MAKLFDSLSTTVILGIIITVIMIIVAPMLIGSTMSLWPNLQVPEVWNFLFRWFHVLSGVMWIGLLWYFNFVQVPQMPNIPDEQKGAISGHIAPAALFWFRWGAMFTLITGLILALLNNYIVEAFALSQPVGWGMYMGIIMWFNVWFIIWPNQKKILGIVEASAEEKAAAAPKAKVASRINTMLSIPMLYAMVSGQNAGGWFLG